MPESMANHFHGDVGERKSANTSIGYSHGLPAKVQSLLCDYVRSGSHETAPVVRLAPPEELETAFVEACCGLELVEDEEGADDEALLQAVQLTLHYSTRSGSPFFFNQLYGRCDIASLVGDWVSAAVNGSVFTYEVAPVFTLMEKHSLARVARAIGPTFSASHDGLFVPGGSLGNLYAMHLARHRASPKLLHEGASGCQPLVAFVSEEAHYSHLKTARVLGIGSDNLVSVETDAGGAMMPEALQRHVAAAISCGKKPFFVGATAGTTVLGAFDPLRRLAAVCEEHGMWLHVDGAWGGATLFSPTLRDRLDGCDLADSFSMSAHKMLGAAVQCAVFLTRHTGLLQAANSSNAAYLFQPDKLHAQLDVGDKTIQCGRKSDQLKLWMLFKSLGDSGCAARIDHCYALRDYAAKRMRASGGAFVLAFEPSCANLCFWYVPESMRPLPAKEMLDKQHPIHDVAPGIKADMQRGGHAMIGFQAVRGLPNFFRWVFPSASDVEEWHVDEVLRLIMRFGERCAPGSTASAGTEDELIVETCTAQYQARQNVGATGSLSEFPARVLSLLCEYVRPESHETAPVVRLASPDELEEAFAAASCKLELADGDEGADEEVLLQAVRLTLHYSVRSGSPYFFNQLYGRCEPASMVGDWVSTAVNGSVFTYEVAPVFTLMEKHSLARVARAIGPAYSASHDGLFVPGGSLGNLYAMHLARRNAEPKLLLEGACECPPLVAFVSEEAHYSHLKTARVLGIGSENLVSVETDANGAMLPEALSRHIAATLASGKKPFFVGATAGTTVLGAFDPLRTLAAVCKEYKMWLHVDGAWGGATLFSPALRDRLDGCDLADSFSMSAHKMLGAAVQCAVFLTRHVGLLKTANSSNAAYLFQPDKLHADLDVGDKTIQCSRKSDMVKLWMLFKSLGDGGCAARIERCYALREYAVARMRSWGDAFVLAFEPSCANLCFWYVPESMRPLPAKDALSKHHPIHEVAPGIKAEMQRGGHAMIGFQAVRGLPNFFRWVFPSAGDVEERHIDHILQLIKRFGEHIFGGEAAPQIIIGC